MERGQGSAISFSIEKNSEKAFLIAEGEEERAEGIDIKMLLYNRIPGFLPLTIRLVDGKARYCYEIQGMVPLKEFVETHKADFTLEYSVYQGILEALQRGREYFLKEENYVLHPDFFYWNPWKRQAAICYYPEWNRGIEGQMRELTQCLMEHAIHSEKSGVEFIYGMYDLLEREGFWLDNVISYMQGKKEREQVVEEGWQLYRTEGCTGLPEKIEVEGAELTIGRGEGCDILLPAEQISRRHAKLVIRDGDLYVWDCRSTNGTCLNQKRISASQWILCKSGDTLTFADICYRVGRGSKPISLS